MAETITDVNKFENCLEDKKPNVDKNWFSCEVCDKTYSSNQYLTVHKRAHTGEKPYICDYCGKTFADKGYHSVHIKEKHTQVQNSHQCSFCQSILKTKDGLRRHLDSHLKELYGKESKYKKRNKSLYKCCLCDKGFADKTHLNRHEQTHENKGIQNRGNGHLSRSDNTFRKEVADFALKNSRQEASEVYKLSEATVRRYIRLLQDSEMCSICGKEFGWKIELVKHMKDVHKDDSLSYAPRNNFSLNINEYSGDFKCQERANDNNNENIIDSVEKHQQTSDQWAINEMPDEKSENDANIKSTIIESDTKIGSQAEVEVKKRVPFIWANKAGKFVPDIPDVNCVKQSEESLKVSTEDRAETSDEVHENPKISSEDLNDLPFEVDDYARSAAHFEDLDNENRDELLDVPELDETDQYSQRIKDNGNAINIIDTEVKEKSGVVENKPFILNGNGSENIESDYLEEASYPKTELEDEKLLISLKEENDTEDKLKMDFKEELDSDSEASKTIAGMDTKFLLEEIKITPSGSFKCSVCSKSFQHKRNAQKHIKVVHMGRKDWSCELCAKRFGTGSDLTRHMKSHTLEKTLKCEFCDQLFGHNFTLKKHILAMHSERKLECHLCDKKFPNQKMLEIHMERHNPSRLFQCDVCNKQFKQNFTLKEHLRLHNEDDQIACDKCPKRFISMRRLNEHNESAHMDKNTVEIYKCDVCAKTFSNQRSVRDHQLVHKDVKEMMCSFCGSSFKGERKLKYHIRSVHAVKTFKCEVCPKVFSTNASLIRHNKYHLNQKDFACQFCPKAFYEKKPLDDHINVAHVDNPERFPCEYCFKTYTRKNNIRQHLLVCKKKPYS